MTRERLPLPEPDCRLPMDGPPRYRADQMHAYADAENAALRAELLREHADHKQTVDDALLVLLENRTLAEQVRVLREALQAVQMDKSYNCLKVEKTQDKVRAALEATK